MKRILICVVLFFYFAFFTFAVGNVGFFVDYTTVSMTEINEDINLLADTYIDSMTMHSLYPDVSVSNFGSGLIFGAVASVSVMPMLDIGIRAGYLYAFPGKIKLTLSEYGYFLDMNVEYNISLIPIEGGFSFKLNLPASAVSLCGGIYAGYGIANSSIKMKFKSNIPDLPYSSVEIPMEGGCLVVDILANAGISIGPAMSLFGEFGYRIANIEEMIVSKYVSVPSLGMNIRKGEVYKSFSNEPTPFNLSGLVAGLKFNIGF